ncbi:MAG: hypothetical protein Q9207_002813 [Kuettlingeria erythrocarpa]
MTSALQACVDLAATFHRERFTRNFSDLDANREQTIEELKVYTDKYRQASVEVEKVKQRQQETVTERSGKLVNLEKEQADLQDRANLLRDQIEKSKLEDTEAKKELQKTKSEYKSLKFSMAEKKKQQAEESRKLEERAQELKSTTDKQAVEEERLETLTRGHDIRESKISSAEDELTLKEARNDLARTDLDAALSSLRSLTRLLGPRNNTPSVGPVASQIATVIGTRVSSLTDQARVKDETIESLQQNVEFYQKLLSPVDPTLRPVEMTTTVSSLIPELLAERLELRKKVELGERTSPASKEQQRCLIEQKDTELGVKTNEANELQRELKVTKEKSNQIDTQHKAVTKMAQIRDDKIAELERQLRSVTTELDEAKEEVHRKIGVIKTREWGFQDLREQLAEMKQKWKSAEGEHRNCNSIAEFKAQEVRNLQERLTTNQANASEATDTLKELAEVKEGLSVTEKERDTAEADYTVISKDSQSNVAEISSLRKQLSTLKKNRDIYRTDYENSKTAAAANAGQMAELRNRLDRVEDAKMLVETELAEERRKNAANTNPNAGLDSVERGLADRNLPAPVRTAPVRTDQQAQRRNERATGESSGRAAKRQRTARQAELTDSRRPPGCQGPHLLRTLGLVLPQISETGSTKAGCRSQPAGSYRLSVARLDGIAAFNLDDINPDEEPWVYVDIMRNASFSYVGLPPDLFDIIRHQMTKEGDG